MSAAELPASLQAAMAKSVERGVAYLEATVGADGAWPGRRYGNLELAGAGVEEQPPFIAALGVLALAEVPGADRILSCTRLGLAARLEYPGVWRYWRTLPADNDDTAVCSLAVGAHPLILLGRNIERMIATRDDGGRFPTWLVPRDAASWFRNDVDAVVNANVLAYLGDRPETRGAQYWVEELIERGDPGAALVHYADELDLYAAAARASDLGRPVLARVAPLLAERIKRRLGGLLAARRAGNELRTAQALAALAVLGANVDPQEARRALARLVDAQRADGGWVECLVWKDERAPGQPVGFGSEALTAAVCIAALVGWSATRD